MIGYSRNSVACAQMRNAALGGVSALALSLGLAVPAAAQDAPASTQDTQDEGLLEETPGGTPEAVEDDENTIVVTGFRASLGSAQDVKRDADTFVDVITAEDIGALPDRSVAEALQRVPGVNVSRFEGQDDPDRFSVEGSGIIIRGLPFVRSELNGREIFSANGGRSLSFNDVSPELLGRVEVFKNTTADMIDGGISGTVNLVTRKPLDNRGFKIAGTIEANYGDLAEKVSPGFSGLISDTFDTGIGTFGVQLGYAQQELITRTDASQITDPCYRAPSLDGPCLRVRPVTADGVGGDATQFDETNFPPEGSVIVPKGAGVRTTRLERDRRAYSGVLQWESRDGGAVATLEYLRAEIEGELDEFSALALVNDDALFPVVAPGTTPTFNGNQFETITLTQFSPFNPGGGIPLEFLRFQREDDAMTQDISFDFKASLSDRVRFNLEAQYIDSDRNEVGVIAAMQSFADIAIDNRGKTPVVQFLQPGTGQSPADYFADPGASYYWFLIDNQVQNEGSLGSIRGDFEVDLSDSGLLRHMRFGARWAERSVSARNSFFSNWGNLSAPWTGGGAVYGDQFDASQVRSPFADGFQRGEAPTPFGDGRAVFFGGDDFIGEYLSGVTEAQAGAINAISQTPNPFIPLTARAGLTPGSLFRDSEAPTVDEFTTAAYVRFDFAREFGNGWNLDGNFGLRYIDTQIDSGGQISFPFPGNLDVDENGTVTAGELREVCADIEAGQQAPGYCGLSDARLAEFASVFTGETIPDNATIAFDNWLPSFNIRLDVGGGLLFRGAISRGISRPDLGSFGTGGAIFDNTGTLRQEGLLETGPLFQIFTGNRLLRPVESWNYDLSAEWYFARVGSLTASLFMKDIKGIVNQGAVLREFTSPSGVTTDVLVQGPTNTDRGRLKGAEIAYQHAFDFLPGALGGLGTQLTYTYVDAGDFNNDSLGAQQSPFAAGLPLAGVSKHTANAVLFYERGPISARTAYNWRSSFLQTPRDVIFPFSPIYSESTGQLDASIFFAVTDQIKLGVQGVNLLDEVTRTSQVIDFDGTRVARSAFRNDRRFTFLARFDF